MKNTEVSKGVMISIIAVAAVIIGVVCYFAFLAPSGPVSASTKKMYEERMKGMGLLKWTPTTPIPVPIRCVPVEWVPAEA